jgi:hypothetical protein
MVWSSVAQQYMSCFERVYSERLLKPQVATPAPAARKTSERLPALNLDHLHRLTDGTGIVEHAVFVVPNYAEGYSTDDNARALIAAVLMMELGVDAPTGAVGLASRYLAFLWFAFDAQAKRFHNALSYARQWEEPVGSEDSHGRALWALGVVLGRSNHPGLRGAAGRLIADAIPPVVEFTSPRAWAYAILGLHEYLARFPGDSAALNAAEVLAKRLLALYRDNRSDEWHWFEGGLAYSNARLSQALIRAGQRSGNQEMVSAGLESLDWLTLLQRSEEKDHFVPIGSQGFYVREAMKARFDQQPVEACAVVSACLEAYHATGESRWRDEAWSAFNWFLGRNDKQIALYDPSTGGCRDGLHPDRANENQGAESTLSFLTALLEMRKLEESDDAEPKP